ncbi:hypothetical protein JMJ56_01275 [Belnapia sp. T18]|uniref:Uncharacterized protein n=1 Tax=Belnapia arida TaxID=2804533 RepID=A0ABS1TXM9_9PROT|nr:hypothetical protein [Belnapia arida]MBL6076615.1 hypothetical protein [Belnapia arida]
MIPPSAIPPIASRGPDSSHVRPAAAAAATSPDPRPTAQPNPSMRIDPSLGIVVMEFRDRSGAIAATLPTQRELDAYRSAQRRGGTEQHGAAQPSPRPTPPPAEPV